MGYMLDARGAVKYYLEEAENQIKKKYGSMTKFFDDEKVEQTHKTWCAAKKAEQRFPEYYLDNIEKLFEGEELEKILKNIKIAIKIYDERIRPLKKTSLTPTFLDSFKVNYDSDFQEPKFFTGFEEVTKAYNDYADEQVIADYINDCLNRRAYDLNNLPAGLSPEILITNTEKRVNELVKSKRHESFWFFVVIDDDATCKQIIGMKDYGGMEQTRVSEYMFVDHLLPLEVQWGEYAALTEEELQKKVYSKIQEYNGFLGSHDLNHEVLLYDEYFNIGVTKIDGVRQYIFLDVVDGQWCEEVLGTIRTDNATGKIKTENTFIPIKGKKVIKMTQKEKGIFAL